MTINPQMFSLVLKPFHEWKSEQWAKDWAEGRLHTRQWYHRAYGGYCEKERQKQSNISTKE